MCSSIYQAQDILEGKVRAECKKRHDIYLYDED